MKWIKIFFILLVSVLWDPLPTKAFLPDWACLYICDGWEYRIQANGMQINTELVKIEATANNSDAAFSPAFPIKPAFRETIFFDLDPILIFGQPAFDFLPYSHYDLIRVNNPFLVVGRTDNSHVKPSFCEEFSGSVTYSSCELLDFFKNSKELTFIEETSPNTRLTMRADISSIAFGYNVGGVMFIIGNHRLAKISLGVSAMVLSYQLKLDLCQHKKGKCVRRKRIDQIQRADIKTALSGGITMYEFVESDYVIKVLALESITADSRLNFKGRKKNALDFSTRLITANFISYTQYF